MALFTSLLNFKREALARLRNKRKAQRYAVGAGFPARGSVNLAGVENLAKLATHVVGSGTNWSGSLHNISTLGVSLQLPAAAVTVRGEKVVLTLTLEGRKLAVPGAVAHFRTYPTHSVCGLSLDISAEDVKTGFLQLMESVVIGASMAPVKSAGAGRNPPGLVREQYRAEHGARLFAWRQGKGGEVRRFEFVLGDRCVAGDADWPALQEYVRGGTGKSTQAAVACPDYAYVERGDGEMARLLRLVVPNFPHKVVPNDVRRFVERFIAAPAPKRG